MSKLEINKNKMKHVAGKIYDLKLDADYVLDVLNEKGESLKFCYNTTTRTLCILDYMKDFSKISVSYIKHEEDLHHA